MTQIALVRASNSNHRFERDIYNAAIRMQRSALARALRLMVGFVVVLTGILSATVLTRLEDPSTGEVALVQDIDGGELRSMLQLFAFTVVVVVALEVMGRFVWSWGRRIWIFGRRPSSLIFAWAVLIGKALWIAALLAGSTWFAVETFSLPNRWAWVGAGLVVGLVVGFAVAVADEAPRATFDTTHKGKIEAAIRTLRRRHYRYCAEAERAVVSPRLATDRDVHRLRAEIGRLRNDIAALSPSSQPDNPPEGQPPQTFYAWLRMFPSRRRSKT